MKSDNNDGEPNGPTRAQNERTNERRRSTRSLSPADLGCSETMARDGKNKHRSFAADDNVKAKCISQWKHVLRLFPRLPSSLFCFGRPIQDLTFYAREPRRTEGEVLLVRSALCVGHNGIQRGYVRDVR